MTVFAFGLGGMSLMGLPPSGGFVAKAMLLMAAVAEGQWWWAVVILAGGLLAAGYVFRVLTPALAAADAPLTLQAAVSQRPTGRGAGAGDLRAVAGPRAAAALLLLEVGRHVPQRRSCRNERGRDGAARRRACLAARHAAGLPVVAAQGADADAAGDSRRCPRSRPRCWRSGGTLALPQALLGLQFALDVPGALLLGSCGAALDRRRRSTPRPGCAAALIAGRFVVWWLLTLSGSIGVFMAADLVSFYLVFSMVSLAAYGLIVDDGTPRARRSGLIYVALALLGEAFLLMAFVLLAQGARRRQPADPGCRGGACRFALARRDPDAADPRLRREDRPRAVPRMDAARLSGGADPGRGGAQRRGGQGRRDRA